LTIVPGMVNNMDYKSLIDAIVSWDTEATKKFCDGVRELAKRIDDDCDEGDRQVRFLTGKFTPDDIIKEG